MKKLFCLFLSVFLVLNSCNEHLKYKYAQSFSHKDIGEIIYIEGVELEIDEMIMRPKSVTLIDTILIVTNIGMQNFIHRYDIKNKTKIGESISFGSGPEEMLNVQDVQVSFDDTTVWILDSRKQEAYQYNKYDICISDSPIPLQSIKFNDYFDKMLVLSDNKIVASTLNPENTHLSFYNMQGVLIQDNCDFPDAGITQTLYERIESFLGDMVFDFSTQRIFFAYKQTDLIDIYDIDGNLLYRSHGPDRFFSYMKQYDINQGVKVRSESGKTRDGYYFPVVNNNEIWTLYSGKYFDREIPNYLLDQIIVFNWDGKPIRQYKLDRPIYTFTIDVENQTLYGVSDDPQFVILKFDLKK